MYTMIITSNKLFKLRILAVSMKSTKLLVQKYIKEVNRRNLNI